MNGIACAGVQIFVLAAGGLTMKGRQALLFTSDTEFESVVRQALLGTDTIFLVARTVSDALQIACQRGRELDLAIMTFGEDCHGMTLLSAIHSCYEQLPTLVFFEKDSGHASALAYANGACVCLSKPVSLVELTNAIAALQPTARQLASPNSGLLPPPLQRLGGQRVHGRFQRVVTRDSVSQIPGQHVQCRTA